MSSDDDKEKPLLMVCIINPFANSGKMKDKWSEIEHELKEKLNNINITSIFTKSKGHAITATREAIINGADIIFGAGGDGTLNELINGLFYPKTHSQANGKPFVLINPNIKFCYFPAGTGTDFYKTVSVPSTIDQVIDSINNNKTVMLDVGIVEYTKTKEQLEQEQHESSNQSFDSDICQQQNDSRVAYRYFANIASCGIGGEVDPLSERLRSRWISGKITYAASSFIALLSTRSRGLKIRLDDKDEWLNLNGTNIAVCNGKVFGGGMIVGPFADPTDGILNVTVWNATLKHFLLHNSDLYSGAHTAWNVTKCFDCQKLELDFSNEDNEQRYGEFRLDIDGEGEGKIPATFQIKSHVVPLYVYGDYPIASPPPSATC